LLYTPTTEELTEAPTIGELTQEVTAPTEPATGKTKLNNFLHSEKLTQ